MANVTSTRISQRSFLIAIAYLLHLDLAREGQDRRFDFAAEQK